MQPKKTSRFLCWVFLTLWLHLIFDTVLTCGHDADTINLYQKCTVRREKGRNGSCRRRKTTAEYALHGLQLREALIDLILEKPLVSITVKDICARADINRLDPSTCISRT